MRYNGSMLDQSIEVLKGIGAKRMEALQKYGIFTIRDILYHFPYKYKDIRKTERFNDKHHGEEIVVRAHVLNKPTLARIRSQFTIVRFDIGDGTSLCRCIYFNQPYMAKNIHKGDEFIFIGHLEQKGNITQMNNPQMVKINEETPDVLTYYRLPRTVNQKVFVKILRNAYQLLNHQIPEHLPIAFRTEYGLAEINYAMENIHFPSDLSAVDRATYRLAFEEMLYFMLILRRVKQRNDREMGIRMHVDEGQMDQLLQLIPFQLTGAQQRVVSEIQQDISAGHPMNRLLQGDVGSGKTVIAMMTLYIAVCNGYQGAMMAPTEILAMQHYRDLSEIFEKLNIKVKLLSASMKAAAKRQIRSALKDGEIDIIVGTHAVIQDSVAFRKLGVAITDEQHRFGVNQRALLSQKGENPHLLVMSATPVPRTLALIMYGDLDISILDELPPGRKKVETRLVTYPRRKDMYQYLAKQLQEEEQAYIVCPLIEESEKLDVQSATELYEELRSGVLNDVEIGLIHGRMKEEHKQMMLNGFAEGRIRALISTTVIEVGVNVPNATIMIIENAERFGLAQLHQLRGRVGRGSRQSWCFMTTQTENAISKERLSHMVQTSDGFVIAEKDLELRGPGQFLGMQQSGLLDKRVILLMKDAHLVQDIKRAIDQLEQGKYGQGMDAILLEAEHKYENRLDHIVLN